MAEKQELRIPLSEAKAYGNGKDVFLDLLQIGKIGEYGLGHIQWKEDGVDGIISFEANHLLTPFERDDIKQALSIKAVTWEHVLAISDLFQTEDVSEPVTFEQIEASLCYQAQVSKISNGLVQKCWVEREDEETVVFCCTRLGTVSPELADLLHESLLDASLLSEEEAENYLSLRGTEELILRESDLTFADDTIDFVLDTSL